MYKDEQRGTWEVWFYYTDWTGKRHRKHKRGFERKKDAQEWEREFLSKEAMSPNMAFSSLVDLYFKDMAGRLKATTLETKTWIINTHILPFFSELPINKITATHVRKWQGDLIARNHAPTYLKTINNQLVAVMNYAVKYYGLPSNPCRVAGAMGRKDADAMKFWTYDQFSSFIVAVDRMPARVGFELLYWTGMRIGELLALTEEDFDFHRRVVSITRNYQRVAGEGLIDDPKTKKGRRAVPLPEAVIATVQEYIPRLYDYKAGDRLFPYTKHYFHHAMRKGCAASGIEYIRLHDLRHSHAALLIEMNVPILLVSERLGHENPQITLNVYGHLYPNQNSDLMKKLEEITGNSGQSEQAP